MRIKQAIIENFRSFRGQTKIDFSPDKVTVLCGENGGGKTNFLNAIYWCITGKTTPRCTSPGHLSYRENGKVIAKAKVTVVLDVSNESGKDLEYEICRQVITESVNAKELPQSHVSITEIVSGGRQHIYREERDVKDILNRYWPSKLAQWFFFDSEAIGELKLDQVMDSEKKKFLENVRSALGLDAYFMLAKDLRRVSEKISKEIRESIPHNADLTSLTKVKEALQARILKATSEIEAFDKTIREALEKKQAINDQLDVLPKSQQTQELLRAIEGSLIHERRRCLAVRNNLAKATGRFSLTYKEEYFKDLLAFIIKEKQAQRIPSSIHEQLIKDIINNKKCICGHSVTAGSEEYQALISLLNQATSNELNDRLSSIQNLLERMNRRVVKEWDAIAGFRNELNEIHRRIKKLEDQKEEHNKQLSNSNDELVRQLKADATEQGNIVTRATYNKGQVDLMLKNYRMKLDQAETQTRQLERKLATNAKLTSELDLVTELRGKLALRTQTLEEYLLKQLSDEMNRMIGRYLMKHRKVTIDSESYSVRYLSEIYEHTNPSSTGEEQILKFAFLSAMMSLANKRNSILENHHIVSRPLFVDAPFSTLDSHYREAVAFELSNNCDQLILLTASDGWTEQIQKRIAPYIGKQYLITFKEKGPQGNKLIKQIKVGEKTYDMNSYDAEHSHSVIEEIKNEILS